MKHHFLNSHKLEYSKILAYYWTFFGLAMRSIFGESLQEFLSNTQMIRLNVTRLYVVIPTLNALIAIILIASYRNALMNFMKRIWKRNSANQVWSVGPTRNNFVVL
jgi:hypothetical protein